MKAKIATLFLIGILYSTASQAQQQKAPLGYTYGTSAIAKSPMSLEELKLLQQSLLFGEDDIKYLKMSHGILKDQTSDILDVWYGFVASTPQLVYFFGNKTTGKPDGEYLAKVSNT